MEMQKVFVRQDGKADIQCPRCKHQKLVTVNQLAGKHNLKVKCKCASVFGVQLEFREKYRKETDLTGFYQKVASSDKWGNIIYESLTTNSKNINCSIHNISVLGIGLTSLVRHHLQAGDHLHVKFTLNNSASQEIEKTVVVRNVRGNDIGCEFLETDKHDKTLAFYVL